MSSEINYNVCVTNVEGKNMSSIGANIKNLREQCGMSQNELAAKVGKSRAAISQYEHDNTIPRMGVIEDMARVFGVKKSAIIESRTEYAFVNLANDDERELVELYRQLPTKAQKAILHGLREYLS
jgi:transcriptional regulator with XRE-family HTH domain